MYTVQQAERDTVFVLLLCIASAASAISVGSLLDSVDVLQCDCSVAERFEVAVLCERVVRAQCIGRTSRHGVQRATPQRAADGAQHETQQNLAHHLSVSEGTGREREREREEDTPHTHTDTQTEHAGHEAVSNAGGCADWSCSRMCGCAGERVRMSAGV